MKTYALFSSTSKEPLQTYEGEEMVQNKEYVSIYKRVPRQNSAHSEAGSSCCDSPWPRPVGESNLRASFRCSWKQNGPGAKMTRSLYLRWGGITMRTTPANTRIRVTTFGTPSSN